VLNLRFDPDKSPLTTIPEDLRKPVLEILLRHADGAVRNVRGRWLGFDPLAENEVHRNALEVS
jgi:hypothetical protein